ncbi:MAG: U32 family peptidase [Erysipelotrichaceae bacterium]|nr:U32 family peptidase [Erysipelotrichaceae bacterium]
MPTVELLAPAGNMEALHAAVQNGADAVYLAGSLYGARAFAGNFNREEMLEAIAYCHNYQVKVYVTMNTILYPNEIHEAYEYAKFLHQNKVDALIIQDFGLLELLHKRLPELELHASTQMHAHNLNAIRLLKDAGITRVVVARETPIELIRKMSALGVEIEMFVYGALCVCYSGQCYLSAYQGNRSGNKGECAQPCRLTYELLQDGTPMNTKGNHLLSPKDLNTLSRTQELIESGVSSFKIEGRMKRPEYVGFVTSQYRQAMDQATFKPDITSLQKLFHRGFTEGHLFSKRGFDLMNPVRPNHVGIPIGTVTGYRNKQVFITLSHSLNQQDGIRILGKNDQGFITNRIYKNGLLVNHAEPNDTIAIDCDHYIQKGSTVVLTSDIQQLKQIRNTYQKQQRYFSISAKVTARINHPFSLTLMHGNYQVTVESTELVQMAQKQPLTSPKIQEQLTKTLDTPFLISSIEIDIDKNIFLSLKTINEVRRNSIQLLLAEIAKPQKIIELPYVFDNISSVSQDKLTLHIHTEEQYQALQAYNYPIYTDSYELWKQHPELGYLTSRVNEEDETIPASSTYVRELGQLYINHPNKKGDIYFNITNAYAAYFLFSHNCQSICLSLELSDLQKKDFMKQYQEIYHTVPVVEYPLYNRSELMVSKYCAANTYGTKTQQKHCNLCKQHLYHLKQQNTIYPLQFDHNCMMHILQPEVDNKLQQIKEYQSIGIQSFSIRFTQESTKEVKDIIEQFIKASSV